MALSNPTSDLSKTLFEEPAGLLRISPLETRIIFERNLDLTSGADHLQQASGELSRRTAAGWRVRRTPATNHHCGLYAIYQGFVALSRRYSTLIPGPVPSLDDVYNWLVRDRRAYQRFVYQEGDFSAAGDLAAYAFDHDFSSEQLDLLATWLGQQSHCQRPIRVISLLQDKTAPAVYNRHYMVHGRMSTPIDTSSSSSELYLFVHHAPATTGSQAHWSMFSDRSWEFAADEDPTILNGTESGKAENNWELEKMARKSKPRSSRHPPKLPPTEKLAWVCGHLTRNPMTNYESSAMPRTGVTPQQVSQSFGLPTKDSNIRKAIQNWRERQVRDETKASKWLTDRTVLDQLSIARGKAKPRLIEYQRELIEHNRPNEATNSDALRQYIDAREAGTSAADLAAIVVEARETSPPSPGRTAGTTAAPEVTTPPTKPRPGPYYLRGNSPISPGKTYPAPKDKQGKRIRTPSVEREEDESSSEEDSPGKEKKRNKRRASESDDNSALRSPHNSDDDDDGGNGAAPGTSGSQPPPGPGDDAPRAGGSARGSGRGTTASTSYMIDPQLLRLRRMRHFGFLQGVHYAGVRRRSWPMDMASTATRTLRGVRAHSPRNALSRRFGSPSARGTHVRRPPVHLVRRLRRSWLKRAQQSALEGIIVLGLSVGAFTATRSLMSVEWNEILAAASAQVTSLYGGA